MKMNDRHSRNECVDHPLGILCRCDEYREIAKKFVVNTVGTVSCMSPQKIHCEEPVAPSAIIWTLEKTEANANPTKPIIQYPSKKINKIHHSEIDRVWIPVNTCLVSATELRRNTSYLHRTSPNSQSADISVLTDMLPHRGHAIKRRDIDWYIGSHTTPVEMTDEPEMNFSSVKGCFSNWAEAYTLATGRPAY